TFSGNRQLIGSWPDAIKSSFVFENGFEPKKPRCADKGLGCGEVRIKCLFVSISVCFFLAAAPHKMNTIGSTLSFNEVIAKSVNSSHPFPRCEFAWPSRTVSTVFNKKTPCSAQDFK